jgi:hypothetical protein
MAIEEQIGEVSVALEDIGQQRINYTRMHRNNACELSMCLKTVDDPLLINFAARRQRLLSDRQTPSWDCSEF